MLYEEGYAFWGQIQYKCIVLSAQITIKDYSFYILHQILIKLGIHHYWANVPHKCVRIRNSVSGGPWRGT